MMETKKEAWSYCSIYLGLWQKHVTFFLQAFWSKKDTNCNRILSCWEFRQENMSSNYMHMQLNAAAAKYVQSNVNINTQKNPFNVILCILGTECDERIANLTPANSWCFDIESGGTIGHILISILLQLAGQSKWHMCLLL